MVANWFIGTPKDEFGVARFLLDSKRYSSYDVERLGIIKDYLTGGTILIGCTLRMSDGSSLPATSIDVTSGVNVVYGYYLSASSVLLTALSSGLSIRSIDIVTDYKVRFGPYYTRISSSYNGSLITAPTGLTNIDSQLDPYLSPGQYRF